MSKVKVTVYPNRGNMRALFQPQGDVGRGLDNATKVTAKRAQRNILKYGRVRTRAMHNKTQPGKQWMTPRGPRQQVNTGVRYAIFQHQGTKHGIKPAPFLADAVKELRPTDFQVA